MPLMTSYKTLEAPVIIVLVDIDRILPLYWCSFFVGCCVLVILLLFPLYFRRQGCRLCHCECPAMLILCLDDARLTYVKL